jgi:hypothetical protein
MLIIISEEKTNGPKARWARKHATTFATTTLK